MSGNRFILYGIAAVSASALLWVGFIRKVEADPGTLVRSAELLLQAAQAMPETIDGAPNALRARFLAEAERDLALAAREMAGGPALADAEGEDDGLAFILECLGFARYLAGDRQGAIDFYRKALHASGCTAERRASIEITIVRILIGGKRPAEALESLARIPRALLAPADQATCNLLRSEALLMQGAAPEEVVRSLALVVAQERCRFADLARAAEIYEQLGMRSEALGVLERAAPCNEGAYFPLARLKFLSGDVDGAARTLGAVVWNDPAALMHRLEKEEMAPLLEDPRIQAILVGGGPSAREKPPAAGKPGEEQLGKRAGTGSPARAEKEFSR